jgi:hypothetical protein
MFVHFGPGNKEMPTLTIVDIFNHRTVYVDLIFKAINDAHWKFLIIQWESEWIKLGRAAIALTINWKEMRMSILRRGNIRQALCHRE